MNAIEITNLNKTFRGISAVKDLNLTVPDGAIYGFIGENGSGKSTTEKMICGLIIPNSGDIKLFGKSYHNPEVRANIGVLIEQPACFPNSTVYQNLMMQALNLDILNPKSEVMRVLDMVNMETAAHRKYKECSLGMKQRIGIAQALLGNPQLLILDEPINGLDADGMRIVRDVLLKLNKEFGITILISSHILGELSKIATHYGIIRKGALIREIEASDMSRECRDFIFVKALDNNKALRVLAKNYQYIEIVDDGIRIYDETDTNNVLKHLYKNEIDIEAISFQKIGLEEYYLQIMSKEQN